jgi:hypothetical protein
MESVEVQMQNGRPVMTNQLQSLYEKHWNDKIVLSVEKLPLKRSDAANRFYWKTIVREWYLRLKDVDPTLTEKKMHRDLCLEYSPVEQLNEETGECEIVGASTSKMNQKEFSQHCKACIEALKILTGEEIMVPEFYEEALNE